MEGVKGSVSSEDMSKGGPEQSRMHPEQASAAEEVSPQPCRAEPEDREETEENPGGSREGEAEVGGTVPLLNTGEALCVKRPHTQKEGQLACKSN